MKKVLFVCAENRKRSQIAEALFNHLAKNTDWIAESAGTMPEDTIDPLTVKVLAELGIQVKNQKPKKITKEMLKNAHLIVSFGCLASAMFPKEKFREWIVDDPKTMDDFRKVRDFLCEKIKNLIDEITRPWYGKKQQNIS